VPQAQAEGITGEGVPVAVIESGIDPSLPLLDGAHLTVHEPSFCTDTQGYVDWAKKVAAPITDIPAAYEGFTTLTWWGTNMVALIVGNGRGSGGQASVAGIAPGADVQFYAIDNAEGVLDGSSFEVCPGGAEAEARAIVKAVDNGARIIMITETAMEPNQMVSDAVAYALHKEVIVVAAAQTWKNDTSKSRWFGGLNGVVAVEATKKDGKLLKVQDGPAPRSVTVTAPGEKILMQGDYRTEKWDAQYVYPTGSEFATAFVVGILADVAQRWPGATNDQLIQSLVRNTGPDEHGLVHDPTTGYGAANLPHMLKVDPTGYEDVNPLIVPDDGQEHGLTAQDIQDARRPVWPEPSVTAATPAVSPSPLPVPEGSGGAPGWVWWGAAVLVLVAAAVVGIAGRARARPTAGFLDGQDGHRPTTTSTEEE